MEQSNTDMYGNWGKILRIDLTNSEVGAQTMPAEQYRKFIGGSGLASKILFDETDANTDPLGPENVLTFMAGPLTGTTAPLSGRHAVAALSPLTEVWGEADSGGSWGHFLKKAGWDGIVVSGCAGKPVYIHVNNSDVSIRSAEHLWGKDTFETDAALKKEIGDNNTCVSCIGQAGENLVRFANVLNDGIHARVAGRCGLGAVMGSKKLKAIVVQGDGRVTAYDTERLRNVSKVLAGILKETTKNYQDYGTSNQVEAVEYLGDLPIKNWIKGSWKEGAAKVNGMRMAETILTGRYGCKNCLVRCGRVVHIEEGPYAGIECGGVEYESIGSLGSMLLIDDLNAVQHMNEVCNRYGMDTISAGSAIAFAVEAAERGMLPKYREYGLDWNRPDVAIRLLHEIGQQKGLGALLAGGSRRAAEQIGQGSIDFAVQCKGLDFPAHDPRALVSLGLGYATSNRGACHVANLSHVVEKGLTVPEIGFPEKLDRFSHERKGVLVARMQNLMALFDAMKLCKFTIIGGGVTNILELFNSVTGYEMSIEQFLQTGERIYNLKRLFNIRRGVDRSMDVLPKRALEATEEGGAKGSVPQLDIMLDEYYEERGWTPNGIPRMDTLEKLGLGVEGNGIAVR